MINRVSTAVFAAAFVVAGFEGHAASVLADSPLEVVFTSDIEAAPLVATGTSLGGGGCSDDDFTCDALVASEGFSYAFNWNDADNFRVALQDENFAVGPADLTVSATFAGVPGREIVAVEESPSDTFLGFLFDPEFNPDSGIFDPTFPAIAVANDADAGTATVDLVFSGISELWWPDGGYFLDFAVTSAAIGAPPPPGPGGGPAPVPLPASILLLGGAVALLAAKRRRT